MKGFGNKIKPVFLKSLTGWHWLNALKLKVNKFSVLHFYARCSGNDIGMAPTNKGNAITSGKKHNFISLDESILCSINLRLLS